MGYFEDMADDELLAGMQPHLRVFLLVLTDASKAMSECSGSDMKCLFRMGLARVDGDNIALTARGVAIAQIASG